jgi:ATP-dependent Clp protease ATP-binding subunit ClpC
VAEDRLITEGDLFKAFCVVAGPGLKEFLRLPALGADLDELKKIDPPPVVTEKAEERIEEKEPALPGKSLAEDSLDDEARRVLLIAEAMARQIGISPIPNRLLLAAFLINPEGRTAALFKRHGIPARRVCAALVASVGGKFDAMIEYVNAPIKEDSQSSIEIRQGVTAETLRRAGELAIDTRVVSEPALFRAFCKVVAPGLKQSLKASPWQIDLDALAADEGMPPDDQAPAPPQAGGGGKGEGATGSDLSAGFAENPESGISRSRFEESAWRVLTESALLARRRGWAKVRTPHLFAAMIGDGTTPVGVSLQRERMKPAEVKQIVLSLVPTRPLSPEASPMIQLGEHVLQILHRALKQADAEGRHQVSEEEIFKAFFGDGGGIIGEVLRRIDGRWQSPAEVGGPRARSLLSSLGEDLTGRARRGELPAVVGRDEEIDMAMQTLLLTQNANPLLVGEAGVGKTAIVEGLARRIAEGRCPQRLQSTRIIELSAGALVANTRLRGEFEQRIQGLLAEARGGIILFIDEIHTIVGAGSGEGSGPDAANMLKAALARGEIRLIGATTHSEYKRTIERDRALSRRFQVQIIHAPSRETTIQILSAGQKALEHHHGVRVTRAAKVTAVDLSGRYITDKQWPAKARDVLERACVSAATVQKGKARGRASVTPRHVARAVSAQTGVPLERVSSSDLSALATLEERVSRRLIGQRHAIRAVVDAIRRGRQGLANSNRPWGVFLFVGAPGVGKTELAKVLAEEVFGGEDGLIRFDMGDFTEPHSTAKLNGAPPGYVGYNQGAPLVERLRQHPYSLLLFDEIEHAHENVLAVLLRLFAEGTITDVDGRLADARNSIVILTTNLLGDDQPSRRLGFAPESRAASESSQTELRALLDHHLPAKLTDRLDGVIRFNPLALADLEMIAARKIEEIVERVAAIYKITVEADEEVSRWLAEKAASESSGARAVQRVVDEQVGSALTTALSSVKAGETARLRLELGAYGSGIECASLDEGDPAGD